MLSELAPQTSKGFKDFVNWLFTRGTATFIIILGRRETGKTDFSLLLAQILKDLGLMKFYATNIKIYKSYIPFEHITNLDDLRFWCKNNKGRKLFIFDEYGKAMRRRSPMSSLNQKLIDDLQILRKYKLSTIAVTVNEKYIDNASLGDDILDGVFIKPNYKNQKIAYYNDLLDNFRQRFYDIPRTSVDYDTFDVAPFKEHGPLKVPKFKEEQKKILWQWSHGKTAKEIGVSRVQIHRISTKFIKEVLEKESNK